MCSIHSRDNLVYESTWVSRRVGHSVLLLFKFRERRGVAVVRKFRIIERDQWIISYTRGIILKARNAECCAIMTATKSNLAAWRPTALKATREAMLVRVWELSNFRETFISWSLARDPGQLILSTYEILGMPFFFVHGVVGRVMRFSLYLCI